MRPSPPPGREARLTVQVQPRASRNEIVARGGGALRVRVTAPPADGAANEAVRALLAEALARPRADVTIVRGQAARTKLVRIAGLTPEELRVRLAAVAPS
ncbi:MAG: DUF167 domain-containing protein [Candidatus Rokubacteria bacterium]|nr:DUF167 domain-containing protein [Candidatus Rokubacteria bacterium]